MPRIGPLELVIILVIVLLIFGAGRLPEIGSALGRSIREFRKSTKGEESGPKAEAQAKAVHGKKEKPGV